MVPNIEQNERVCHQLRVVAVDDEPFNLELIKALSAKIYLY